MVHSACLLRARGASSCGAASVQKPLTNALAKAYAPRTRAFGRDCRRNFKRVEIRSRQGSRNADYVHMNITAHFRRLWARLRHKFRGDSEQLELNLWTRSSRR